MLRRFSQHTPIAQFKSLTILTACLAMLISCGQPSAPTPLASSSFSYQIRVQDKRTGEIIERAKVTINVSNQAPLDTLTDSNGVARVFIDNTHAGQPGELRIEAANFKTYIQNIDIVAGALPDNVQLEAAVAASPADQGNGQASIVGAPTSTDVPTAAGKDAPTAPPLVIPASIQINDLRTTSWEGFTFRLNSVDFSKKKRMRWYFTFINNANEDVNLGFIYAQTYMVDENNHRYKVIDVDTNVGPGGTFGEIVQRGVGTDHWFEFDAPLNGAKDLKMQIVRSCILCPDFPMVELELDTALTITPVPTVSVTASANELSNIQIDDTRTTSWEGFTFKLHSIEFPKGKRMRWNFTFINNATQDVNLGFFYSQTYMVDENNHRYALVAVDTNAGPAGTFGEIVQRGVGVDHWFEFDAPLNGAKDLKIQIVRSCILCPDFPMMEVNLD
jgi:hypothetical protein